MDRIVGSAFAIALIAVGCKKETPDRAAPPQPVPATPAPADATAPQAEELLHRVPMRVAVSSAVANGAYSPFDLVDGELATAWNSRTGEARPWIAFRVPPSTHVERVRMTVGFTRNGPEGDYFTMNRRIKKVRVWHDGVSRGEVALDPESRALQDVPIDANGGDYRIEIIETVPGTRKDWREVCVSELDVLGRPPPGMKPHDELELLVGSLDGTPISDPALELTPLATYASVGERCKQSLATKEEPCDSWERGLGRCRSQPRPPTCREETNDAPALPSTLPGGWKSARWISTESGVRQQVRCDLAFEPSTGGLAAITDLDDCGRPQGHDGRVQARYEATTRAGWFVLVTAVMDLPLETNTRQTVYEQLRVCGNDRDGDPACTDPIPIGQLVHVEESGGEPGADGLDIHDERVWGFRFKLAGDVLTIEKDVGKPDHDASAVLGRHRLRR